MFVKLLLPILWASSSTLSQLVSTKSSLSEARSSIIDDALEIYSLQGISIRSDDSKNHACEIARLDFPAYKCTQDLQHLHHFLDADDYAYIRELEYPEHVLLSRAKGATPPNNPSGTTQKKSRPPPLSATKDHYTAARAAFHKTHNLPKKNTIYKSPSGVTVTGKHVRMAIFNAHLSRISKTGAAQPFRNRWQKEVVGNRKKTLPLPRMKSVGIEYPVTSQKYGYKGEKSENKGPIRAIISRTKKGHKFEGVVAHGNTKEKDPDYYNHYEVKAT